jgi:2-hydroxymuconate-semialdehyde hydrolase
MTMSENNPEIGKSIATVGYKTNYHDQGAGPAVLMLHGSGAGVTGWANWRGQIPALSPSFRVVAPDLIGFGYTERLPGFQYKFMDTWVDQMLALLDALEIGQAHVVGNSFGGSLALALAVRAPARIGRMVLMGSGGVAAPVTPELEELWGYKPSAANMKKIMSIMAHNQSLVSDEIAEMRYRATMRPGVQEAFEQLFPPPRQRWLDAQIVPDDRLRALSHPVLIVHGREDRVVPPSTSQRLFELIPNAQLHLIGQCGHWTMIEHRDRFNRMVADFFSES